MPVLILTHADLKPLCAIGAADTSEDSDLDALIVAQQPVLEYAIDPAILAAASANAGLQATLSWGWRRRWRVSFCGVRPARRGLRMIFTWVRWWSMRPARTTWRSSESGWRRRARSVWSRLGGR